MPYKVNFVGLVCFYREPGARLALLPDGRDPGGGIDPHYASIRVSAEALVDSQGWEPSDDVEDGIFELPPCEVVLAGAAQSGPLDVEEHDRGVPQLRHIAPDFEIDPARAQTIARVRIAQGSLKAFHIPEGTAVVSQLEVAHDGEIEIIVRPDDGSAVRTIRVRPGAEIAIANMARAGIYDTTEPREGHFRIYEKLSIRPVTLTEPATLQALPELRSRHPLFVGRGPISLYVDCTNTGCCRPPDT